MHAVSSAQRTLIICITDMFHVLNPVSDWNWNATPVLQIKMLILGLTCVSRPKPFPTFHTLSSHIIVSCLSQTARPDRGSLVRDCCSGDADPEGLSAWRTRAAQWHTQGQSDSTHSCWWMSSVTRIKSLTFLLWVSICIDIRSLVLDSWKGLKGSNGSLHLSGQDTATCSAKWTNVRN